MAVREVAGEYGRSSRTSTQGEAPKRPTSGTERPAGAVPGRWSPYGPGTDGRLIALDHERPTGSCRLVRTLFASPSRACRGAVTTLPPSGPPEPVARCASSQRDAGLGGVQLEPDTIGASRQQGAGAHSAAGRARPGLASSDLSLVAASRRIHGDLEVVRRSGAVLERHWKEGRVELDLRLDPAARGQVKRCAGHLDRSVALPPCRNWTEALHQLEITDG